MFNRYYYIKRLRNIALQYHFYGSYVTREKTVFLSECSQTVIVIKHEWNNKIM